MLDRWHSALIFEHRHVWVGLGFPTSEDCAADVKPGVNSERLFFADYASWLIYGRTKRS